MANVRVEEAFYHSIPTVNELSSSSLYKIASENWLNQGEKSHSDETDVVYDCGLVESIYTKELLANRFSLKVLSLLEYLKYFDQYLWQHYGENCDHSLTMSICVLLNEKYRLRANHVWKDFESEKFENYVFALLEKFENDKELKTIEKIQIVQFFNNCLNSMEYTVIRKTVLPFLSVAIWKNIIKTRRKIEFSQRSSRYQIAYNTLLKRYMSEENEEIKLKLKFKYTFLSNLSKYLIDQLNSFTVPMFMNALDDENDPNNRSELLDRITLLQTILLLFIDILGNLTNRRFVVVLLDDHHIINNFVLSEFFGNSYFSKSGLNSKLKNVFTVFLVYMHMGIDDNDGSPLNERQITQLFSGTIYQLQKIMFKNFYKKNETIKKFCMSTCSTVDFEGTLKALSFEDLCKMCVDLGLADDKKEYNIDYLNTLVSNKFSLNGTDSYFVFVNNFKKFMDLPLYPTEKILWQCDDTYSYDILAHPRLNLQFVSITEYVLRNYYLYYLEHAYQIRCDIEDALGRMKPVFDPYGDISYSGWSRIGLPLEEFNITNVSSMNIGKTYPSAVTASFSLSLNLRKEYADEWKSIKPGDACFLISFLKSPYRSDESFITKFGIIGIRGCEFVDMNSFEIDGLGAKYDKKFKFNVKLDPIQYQIDCDNDNLNVYENIHVIMRIRAKENTFKPVLETIKSIIDESYTSGGIVPEWLTDTILGYGDENVANYRSLESFPYTVKFPQVFVDVEHLKESFPNHSIEFDGSGNDLSNVEFISDNELVVHCKDQSEVPPNIRYTPVQIEAIKSGTLQGLTIIVGPPGTGKTDVAAKILTNLYELSGQQTVILAHSNQALNQIFAKLIDCGIHEKHLLRLGHGEEALETEKDFSRKGRIDYILTRRLELLEQVKLIESSLNYANAVHTCETAYNFYKHVVLKKIEKFRQDVIENNYDPKYIKNNFLFKTLYPSIDWNPENEAVAITLEMCDEMFNYIEKCFTELLEYRAFELITSLQGRSNYLLVKTARIIAMTCTYAAMRRKELKEMGLQYDSVLMEESAQVLEIETLFPLLLQRDSNTRLKRLILIGDHHQLPPVIKNLNLKQFSNIDQSMFHRLIRLGVTYIQLDYQGRCRSSIYDLISWHYPNKIKNLPHVDAFDSFANPGFSHVYQLINVDLNRDKMLAEESEPIPYYYQNVSEAEYAVSLYIYMRLLGYPKEQITIMAMYNGQKQLIKEILDKRCGDNPILGLPLKVTTVDRYQGQQNDYVIVSMTRTKSIGYMRDLRRLVVAFSRGRRGLYVLAHLPLFEKYDEFRRILALFNKNPNKLEVAPFESFDDCARTVHSTDFQKTVVNSVSEMSELSHKLYMERYKKLEEKYQRELEEERVRKEKEEEERLRALLNKKPDDLIQNEIVDDEDDSQHEGDLPIKGDTRETKDLVDGREIALNSTAANREESESKKELPNGDDD